MDKHRGKTGEKVFITNTFEEVRGIELAHAKRTVGCVALRVFIWVWLICANSILKILRVIFFGNHFIDQSKIGNIIVYTVGTLGDNVLLLPAIKSIKSEYANAQLTVITNCNGFSSAPAEEVFGKVPYVDKVLMVPDHPLQRRGLQIRLEPVELKKNNCDLFVNLSPFGNRGWFGAVVREMIFAKKLKTRWAVGFRMSTYTRNNIFNKVQHHFVKNEARRPREILKELGLKPIEGEDLLPIDQNASSAVKGKLSKFFLKKRFLVVLNPGAKLKASQWPPERFGEISRRLAQEYDACVLLNGAESEKSICDQVVETSGGVAINLAGLSVRELIELLRMSDLLITNNTGPMTLSAMIGIPTVVISSTRFSPTFYVPISERMIWVFSFQENSYSYKDDGGPSEDLLNIQVRDVLNAVKELIPRNTEKVSPANERRSAL